MNTCCLRDLEYIRDSQGVYFIGVNNSKKHMLNQKDLTGNLCTMSNLGNCSEDSEKKDVLVFW